MDTDAHGLNVVTEKIIGCAYKVLNELGCGFLEKVYENAMVIALRKAGLRVTQQVATPVYYEGEVVGDYIADLIVEGMVLVELKAVRALDEVHEAQCINFLKATNLPICLLMNYGRPRLGLRRFAGAKLIQKVDD